MQNQETKLLSKKKNDKKNIKSFLYNFEIESSEVFKNEASDQKVH